MRCIGCCICVYTHSHSFFSYVYPPSTSLEFTYNTPFIIPTHYQSTPYLLFQRYNTGEMRCICHVMFYIIRSVIDH